MFVLVMVLEIKHYNHSNCIDISYIYT